MKPQKTIHDVCAILGKNTNAAIVDSEKARARAYAFLSRVDSRTGLPKGVTFAAEGTYSELYAYTNFFVRYFGMVPDCLSVLNSSSDCFKARLHELVDTLGVSGALNRDILDTNAELVFGSGTVAKLKLRSMSFRH